MIHVVRLLHSISENKVPMPVDIEVSGVPMTVDPLCNG